jgi:uncharacterized membrane-anchored protein YhcB (DUF1043 family)
MEDYLLSIIIAYACGAVFGYLIFRVGEKRVPPAVWDRITNLEQKLARAERQRDELLDKVITDITIRDRFEQESA